MSADFNIQNILHELPRYEGSFTAYCKRIETAEVLPTNGEKQKITLELNYFSDGYAFYANGQRIDARELLDQGLVALVEIDHEEVMVKISDFARGLVKRWTGYPVRSLETR